MKRKRKKDGVAKLIKKLLQRQSKERKKPGKNPFILY